jgi:hypothetical protein
MSFFGLCFDHENTNKNYLRDKNFRDIENIVIAENQFFEARFKVSIMKVVVVNDDVDCAGETALSDFNFEGGGKIRVGDPWDICYSSVERVEIMGHNYLKFTINKKVNYYHSILAWRQNEVFFFLEQLESGI